MKHFVITRFNLVNKVWEGTQNATPKVLSEEWLDHRFFLFENYCLPSVRNQVNNNFTWLIAFDKNTPKKYKVLINTLTANTSNTKVLFIDGFEQLTTSLKLEIKKLTSNRDKYIITTRLDNDDIIHKDFTDTIQNLFEPKANLIIDLKKGCQLILGNPSDIRTFQYPFNPFISLVEAVENYNTVLSKEHLQWRFYASKHVLYNQKKLWIQVIHDKNQINEKTFHLRRVKSFTPLNFGIKIKLKKHNRLKNFFFNLKYFPKRFFENTKMYVKFRLLKKT